MRRWPRSGQTIEEAIRAEGRHQASEQAFMSNLIGSLRLISTFDWSEFFESVSLVEQVLQRDPVGVYGRMDFQQPRSLPPRRRGNGATRPATRSSAWRSRASSGRGRWPSGRPAREARTSATT